MSRLLFSTDLHGRRAGFQNVLHHASKQGIRTVVFGGDITPKRYFLRFKDDILVPNRLLPKSLEAPDVKEWFAQVLETNEKAQAAGDAEKYLGLDDAHYAVAVSKAFSEVAQYYTLLYEKLWVHGTRGALYLEEPRAVEEVRSRLSALSDSIAFVFPPDAAERRVLCERIFPLLRKKLGQIFARASDPQLLDAYLRATGNSSNAPPAREFSRHMLYTLLLHAIREAFRSEGGRIQQLVKHWDDLGMQPRNIERGQLKWLREVLIPEIAAFVRADRARRVFIMPGNDDCTKTLEALEKAEAQRILVQVHGKVVPLVEGWQIGGYSFVSDLPLPLIQDWQKDEADILADLQRLFGSFPQERTILSIHVPPRDGLLDINFRGAHIGSSAVRQYLEQSRHPLVLTGHVHEIVSKWGNWREEIGGTLVINPGATHQHGIDALLIDLNDIRSAERIKIE